MRQNLLETHQSNLLQAITKLNKYLATKLGMNGNHKAGWKHWTLHAESGLRKNNVVELRPNYIGIWCGEDIPDKISINAGTCIVGFFIDEVRHIVAAFHVIQARHVNDTGMLDELENLIKAAGGELSDMKIYLAGGGTPRVESVGTISEPNYAAVRVWLSKRGLALPLQLSEELFFGEYSRTLNCKILAGKYVVSLRRTVADKTEYFLDIAPLIQPKPSSQSRR